MQKARKSLKRFSSIGIKYKFLARHKNKMSMNSSLLILEFYGKKALNLDNLTVVNKAFEVFLPLR